jgi:hypothetical protein
MVDNIRDGINLSLKKNKGGPGGKRKPKSGKAKPTIIVMPGHEPPNALQPWDYSLKVQVLDDDPRVDLDCWKWKFNDRTWRAWEHGPGRHARFSRDE